MLTYLYPSVQQFLSFVTDTHEPSIYSFTLCVYNPLNLSTSWISNHSEVKASPGGFGRVKNIQIQIIIFKKLFD